MPGTAYPEGNTVTDDRRWPDERVVRAAQEGDATALDALVAGAQPHVRRFARSLCTGPQDAEDAAQEALIVLYRKVGTLRAAGALASWLFRIVRNECLRHVRSLAAAARSAPAPVAPADGPLEPSAEETVLERLDTARVAAAVGLLPADQRQVLVMRDVHGLPGPEVARSLGLSTAAMKSRLHRARSAVRASLTATPSSGDGGPKPW